MKTGAILFFCNFPPPPNGQNIVTQIYYQFLNDEFSVEVIDTSSGIFLINNTVTGKIRRLKNIFTNYYQLYKTVKKDKPCALYMTASSSVAGHIRDWIPILIASSHGIPITAHVHNGNLSDIFQRKWHLKITNYVTGLVDTFIFLSKSLSEQVGGYLKESQIKVIQNTVDFAVCCSSDEIEKKLTLRLNRKSLDVTFLSNMIPSKGYMDLLNAIPYYKSKYGDEINVNFIGNWATEKGLKEFKHEVDRLGIKKSISLWGGINDRKKLKKQLLKTDVFVLPTYYPLEAQPISIIEALNAGTPVIATHHASIPEYIVDDVNGFLVNKKSPKQIAQALIKLTNKGEWKEKALSARKMYEQKFNPEEVRKKLINHFNSNGKRP